MSHTFSTAGVTLLKGFEGFRANAYYDSVRVLTIGYGTTNADKAIIGFEITPSSTCTEAQATEWLRKAVNSKYGPRVDKYDSIYHWTQNEFDALCSFCYNIGSIDALTDNGKRSKDVIAQKILAYNKAGGKVLAGLTQRRKKEQELFLKGSQVSVQPTNNTKTNVPPLASVTIKKGSSGIQAKYLQQDLNYIAHAGLVEDGKFGDKSVAALKKWQSANKLEADGVYGAKSRAKMESLLK